MREWKREDNAVADVRMALVPGWSCTTAAAAATPLDFLRVWSADVGVSTPGDLATRGANGLGAAGTYMWPPHGTGVTGNSAVPRCHEYGRAFSVYLA